MATIRWAKLVFWVHSGGDGGGGGAGAIRSSASCTVDSRLAEREGKAEKRGARQRQQLQARHCLMLAAAAVSTWRLW